MNNRRIEQVIENMRACGLRQIIVTGTANVYYLTGVWCEPFERMLALLVKDDGDMTLFANRMFALQGLTDVPMIEYEDTDDSVALLAPHLLPGSVGEIGLIVKRKEFGFRVIHHLFALVQNVDVMMERPEFGGCKQRMMRFAEPRHIVDVGLFARFTEPMIPGKNSHKNTSLLNR